jgi:DNA helicase-2/ATP-dependent DNA helicase PcrA
LPLETNGFTLDARMIEEERRLFYVGMTRAKRELRISYRGKPSPFLAQAGLLTS